MTVTDTALAASLGGIVRASRVGSGSGSGRGIGLGFDLAPAPSLRAPYRLPCPALHRASGGLS